MGKQFSALEDHHTKFIQTQHIFFVGSAAAEGRVNVSPKGMDSLRVLAPNRILWRNHTGSGNETAGHLQKVNRMTLMWCGFEKQPMVLRAFGSARTLHPRDDDWGTLNAHFAASDGARQLYDLEIDLVQSSCGFAVPYFDFAGERDTLVKWTADRGSDGVKAYWAERNQSTIDGMPTGILGNVDDT